MCAERVGRLVVFISQGDQEVGSFVPVEAHVHSEVSLILTGSVTKAVAGFHILSWEVSILWQSSGSSS